MIPKNIFFIWIGDKVPPYAYMSINLFKQANPDFKIHFVNYTVKQFENIHTDKVHSLYDPCLIRAMDDSKYDEIRNFYKGLGRKYIQIINNVIRLDLLKTYGGIYLDVDCFPLKPFDEKLLSNESFICNSYFEGWRHRHADNFFIGCTTESDPLHITNTVDVHKHSRFRDSMEWKKNRDLFFECKIKYTPQDSKYYIEHYEDGTWGRSNTKCRTPICKYDKKI